MKEISQFVYGLCAHAHNGDMTDWIGDHSLSPEEKRARFEALGPEWTRGPRKVRLAAKTIEQMPLARTMGRSRLTRLGSASQQTGRVVAPTVPLVPPTAVTSEVGTATAR